MKYYLFFYILFSTVFMAAHASCKDKVYSRRPNECKIQKISDSINLCCENFGAVYCGSKGCICYRGQSKKQRLAQKSGTNLCEVQLLSSPKKNNTINPKEETSEAVL